MRILPRLLFACVSIVSALLARPAGAEGLTVAACANYAPYSDAALPDFGFSNDLTAEIMREAGYDVSVTVLPWIRALEGTEAGTFDILPSAWYSDERAQSLLFSDPIAMSRLVFVKPAGSPFEYRSIDELKGLTIGIVAGYAYNPAFLASPLFQRPAVTDILLNLKMVAARRIDLTLDDELTLRFIINSRAPELAPQLALTHGVLSEQPLYVTFSRKRPDAQRLAAIFNAGLARMRGDGRYQRLLVKHRME
jgi:polar amino acid transport system substrate-binding protein